MTNDYFSSMAEAYKAALHNEIESYCFVLNNGETVTVRQLVDEANLARLKGKKNGKSSKVSDGHK